MDTVLVAHSRDGMGGSVITGALLAKALDSSGEWKTLSVCNSAGPPLDYHRTIGIDVVPLMESQGLPYKPNPGDGNRLQRNIELNLRPTARYSFGMQYTENEIHLRYGNFTVRLISLQSQVAFTSTLSWSTLVQYDNVSEAMGINTRLHWIPEAGRQAFLVLNYGLLDPDKDNVFESYRADLSLKFSYTIRF